VSQRPGPDLEPVHVWVAPAENDQRSAAHELLLSLAESLLGGRPVLRHDELGRPHLDPLWVSVSHGHDLVAVAASASGPVGVDLEQRRTFEVAGLAGRWFDPAELAWMAGQPDEVEAFLRLWTAKEAVGKALGRGLRGSGLRRLMPLTDGLVPSEPELAVVWVPIEAAVVLAVAVPAGARAVEVCEHQGAALRRMVTSRTSFPVVVRGN
jgi:4'-phosphopantetheinyl transferase